MNNQELQQAIVDALTQHNSYLQRLSSHAVNEILGQLDGLSLEMLNQLRNLLEDLSEAELTALSGAKYTTPQLKEVQSILDTWQHSLMVSLPEVFVVSAVALAAYEASYIYRLAGKKPPKLNGEKLYKLASKIPYAGGHLLDYIFPGIAADLRKKVEYVLRDGIANGQTNQQIIQRIKGRKALNYQDGLLNQTRNIIDAEVRTARAHISSNTYLEAWQALGFEYTKDVATLDFRTTSVCMSRDGRVQKIGAGHQATPYHFRCRTNQVGCDKDGDISGLRPFVASDKRVKDIPKDQRDGIIGQVDANTSYKEWFARQDADHQRSVLGDARYKLYKDGKYSIDKFVDPLSGRKFTIAELREMDEQTFRNVGL